MLPKIFNEEGAYERQTDPIVIRPPETSRPAYSGRPMSGGRTLGERAPDLSDKPNNDDLLQECHATGATPVLPPNAARIELRGLGKVKRPGHYRVESIAPRPGHFTNAAVGLPAGASVDFTCEHPEHLFVRHPYSGNEVQEVVEALKDQLVHIVHMGVDEERPHVVSHDSSGYSPRIAESSSLFGFPRGSQAFFILLQKKTVKRACAFLEGMRKLHMAFPPLVALVLQAGPEVAELDPILHMTDNLLKAGAEAVIIQPSEKEDLPQLLASSLGTVRAQRDLRKSAVEERANQLFYQDAYSLLDGFPKMNGNLPEVDASRGNCGSVGRHRFTKLLGSGNYGKVYLLNASGGQPEVVKVIPKANIKSAKHVKQILKECQMLRKVGEHPHIVKFTGITHARRNLYIFMEFAGEMDLEQMMSKSRGNRLDAATAHRIIIQVADAVSHCHRQNVAHRDLKPENVVMNSSASAFLVDFGLAVGAGELCEDKCGTVPFSPPEVYRGLAFEPKSMDVWGLGVLLLHMLCGNHSLLKMMNYSHAPEPDRELADALQSFFDPDEVVPWPMKIRKWNPNLNISSDFLNVMSRAIHIDPQGRCSAHAFYEQLSSRSRTERRSDLVQEVEAPMTARRAPAALPPVRITSESQSDVSNCGQDSRPTFS